MINFPLPLDEIIPPTDTFPLCNLEKFDSYFADDDLVDDDVLEWQQLLQLSTTKQRNYLASIVTNANVSIICYYRAQLIERETVEFSLLATIETK